MNSESQSLVPATQQDESEKLTVDEVRESLSTTEKGQPANTIGNCRTVFCQDPLLRGAIRLNLLTDRVDIVRDLGWRRSTSALTDTDVKYLLLYFEQNYGLTSEKKLIAALSIAANENCYHPIRDVLNSLVWDGIPRIRSCLHHFLGADESDYVEEMLKHFLLGAIRLPNNAFKANAGTEVVTDVIFLQKRDHIDLSEPAWVQLGESANGFAVNHYFADHPEMILGVQTSENTQYGKQDFTVAPMEGTSLENQLAGAIQNIHGVYTEAAPADVEDAETDDSIPADPAVRNYSYTLVDGKVYYRENSCMTPVRVSGAAEGRIKGLIGLRDCVRTLIEYQTEDYLDEDIEAEQRKLNARYDAFVRQYGRITARTNNAAFRADTRIPPRTRTAVCGPVPRALGIRRAPSRISGFMAACFVPPGCTFLAAMNPSMNPQMRDWGKRR